MIVYITKYWEAKGIIVMEGVVSESGAVFSPAKGGWHSFYKTDFHTTLSEAIKRADRLRFKKIASLKKRITQLENTSFK